MSDAEMPAPPVIAEAERIVAGLSDLSLHWYGVWDPELEQLDAVFADRENAEEHVRQVNGHDQVDPPVELREYTHHELLAVLAATQERRIREAGAFGVKPRLEDVP